MQKQNKFIYLSLGALIAITVLAGISFIAFSVSAQDYGIHIPFWGGGEQSAGVGAADVGLVPAYPDPIRSSSPPSRIGADAPPDHIPHPPGVYPTPMSPEAFRAIDGEYVINPPELRSIEAIEAELKEIALKGPTYGGEIVTKMGTIILPDDTYIEHKILSVSCPMDTYCDASPFVVINRNGQRVAVKSHGKVFPSLTTGELIDIQEFESMQEQHFPFLKDYPIHVIMIEEANAKYRDVQAGRDPIEGAKARQLQRLQSEGKTNE